MLSGQGTCTLVPSFCFLRTVPVPDGWQLVDITINVLRSIQALADTLLAWTVCESPLCFRNNYYYAIHTHTHTCVHICTHTLVYSLVPRPTLPAFLLATLECWECGPGNEATHVHILCTCTHTRTHTHMHIHTYMHTHSCHRPVL